MQPKGGPGGAPTLPDAVPSGVQNLLDGIFNWGGDAGRAFGEFVNGLAQDIGGGPAIIIEHGAEVTAQSVSTALDVGVVVA
ncbi:hypothetical protein [Haloarcula sp. JP-L23]|uniref:hypothetical protein n=1 Tax=Haloarcula sp. JP-L23 TaxID=2716717 RepID=UPI00140EAC31|nr:hypothetical protein G9465_12335 [Haloarcula sp. JP-L23]